MVGRRGEIREVMEGEMVTSGDGGEILKKEIRLRYDEI
jgi:hypothetical protein